MPWLNSDGLYGDGCCIVWVLEQDKTNCQMALWTNCILIRQCQGCKMVLQADINLCLGFTEQYFLYQALLGAWIQQTQRQGSIGSLGFYLVCRMICNRSYVGLLMSINMLPRAPFSVHGLSFKIGHRAISQSVCMHDKCTYWHNIMILMHGPAAPRLLQIVKGWI